MSELPIAVLVHSDVASSEGFASFNGYELEVPFLDRRLGQVAAALCDELVRYALSAQRKIINGEKIAWATGTLRAQLFDGALRCFALDLGSGEFEPIADPLLRQWLSQTEVCRLGKSAPDAARLDQYAVVSPGVVEQGDRVAYGVRYPYREPNSGWWLYGRAYDGDLSKMRRVHVGDVVKNDQDLTRFLALVPGMVFQREPLKVNLDREVASSEPI